jgi:hypothetical protein
MRLAYGARKSYLVCLCLFFSLLCVADVRGLGGCLRTSAGQSQIFEAALDRGNAEVYGMDYWGCSYARNEQGDAWLGAVELVLTS